MSASLKDTVHIDSLGVVKNDLRIEKPYDAAIYLRSTTSEVNKEPRIVFENTDKVQSCQIRYNCYDSVRAPFGFHIERAPDNQQPANKAYLSVQGDVVSGGGVYTDNGVEKIGLGGRDITINNKRALVGFKNEDGNKLTINYERDFMNGVEMYGTTQLIGEGETLKIKARWGDHCYMGFYPRSGNLDSRGAWIGYGSAGTDDFMIDNGAGDGMVRIRRVYTGNESKFSNNNFAFTDPWEGMPAAIKAHGNIACNDRMRAWNGHVTYSELKTKSNIVPTDNEILFEQVKSINVYSFKRDAHLFKHLEGGTYAPGDKNNVDIETINYGVFDKDLPYEVTNYSCDDPTENQMEIGSYLAMLTGAINHMASELESTKRELEEIKNGTI